MNTIFRPSETRRINAELCRSLYEAKRSDLESRKMLQRVPRRSYIAAINSVHGSDKAGSKRRLLK